MKKILFVILLIVCTISLTSCKKEKTIDYEQIYRYNLFEIVETLTEEEIMKQIEEAVDAFYDATYINISLFTLYLFINSFMRFISIVSIPTVIYNTSNNIYCITISGVSQPFYKTSCSLTNIIK